MEKCKVTATSQESQYDALAAYLKEHPSPVDLQRSDCLNLCFYGRGITIKDCPHNIIPEKSTLLADTSYDGGSFEILESPKPVTELIRRLQDYLPK
jgi:hypothetical protein